MGRNFERFLFIISKWPIEVSRSSLDYGQHLRKLIKNKDIYGNVFSGNSVENTKILDSLARLLNNTYMNKYPCALKEGALKIEEKKLEDILRSNIINKHKEK